MSNLRRTLRLVSFLVMVGIYAGPIRAQSPAQCDYHYDYSQAGLEVRRGYWIPLAPLASIDELKSSRTLPLEVTLMAVDKKAYAINESIVFDVKFTNNSSQPITLPVAYRPIYPSKVEYPPLLDAYPNGYRHLGIEFHVQRDSVGLAPKNIDSLFKLNLIAFTSALFGSPDVPGSLRRLEPGHCVTFRLHSCLGVLFENDRKEILNKTSTAKIATMAVYFYQPKDPVFGKFLLPAISNSLPIAILGQEVPIVDKCIPPSNLETGEEKKNQE
ncbi:MAG TPA: hypothetical protein VJ302_32310 [Blastocatellia bacterium]|nr:hypothetical protein [Blastocatellia bacterium]